MGNSGNHPKFIIFSRDSVIIEIEFPSSNLSLEVEEFCKNLVSCVELSKNSALYKKIKLPVTEIKKIFSLLDILDGVNDVIITVGDKIISYDELMDSELFCYSRSNSDFPGYCFNNPNNGKKNIWGCHRFLLDLDEDGGGWLNFGYFDKNRIWHFDKSKIANVLSEKVKENRFCPYIDEKRIATTLNDLPDRINPAYDKQWDFTYDKNNKEVGVKPLFSEERGFLFSTKYEDFSFSDFIKDNASENVDLSVENEENRVEIIAQKLGWGVVLIMILGIVLVALAQISS